MPQWNIFKISKEMVARGFLGPRGGGSSGSDKSKHASKGGSRRPAGKKSFGGNNVLIGWGGQGEGSGWLARPGGNPKSQKNVQIQLGWVFLAKIFEVKPQNTFKTAQLWVLSNHFRHHPSLHWGWDGSRGVGSRGQVMGDVWVGMRLSKPPKMAKLPQIYFRL